MDDLSPLQKGLVTSQNVTAPKHFLNTDSGFLSLVTSQNVTAPKLLLHRLRY